MRGLEVAINRWRELGLSAVQATAAMTEFVHIMNKVREDRGMVPIMVVGTCSGTDVQYVRVRDATNMIITCDGMSRHYSPSPYQNMSQPEPKPRKSYYQFTGRRMDGRFRG